MVPGTHNQSTPSIVPELELELELHIAMEIGQLKIQLTRVRITLGKRVPAYDWYVKPLVEKQIDHYESPLTQVFFFCPAILHYQWSNNPAALQDPLNKALASIANAILWASSAWYAKTGVTDNAVSVGLSAALQAYAVFSQ